MEKEGLINCSFYFFISCYELIMILLPETTPRLTSHCFPMCTILSRHPELLYSQFPMPLHAIVQFEKCLYPHVCQTHTFSPYATAQASLPFRRVSWVQHYCPSSLSGGLPIEPYWLGQKLEILLISRERN